VSQRPDPTRTPEKVISQGEALAGSTRRWTDHEVEQLVGRLLQLGVLIATVVVLLGGAMLLATHGSDVPSFRIFRGASSTLRSVSSAWHGALAMDPRGMVQLGLVLLIATPVARVALTLGAFLLQRDRLYVMLTATVLVLLLFGLFS
jgi:uncharacterized membrane protein